MGLEHPWILVSMAGWGGSWNQSPVDTEEQLVQYPARGYWMKENYSLFICYFFVNLSVNSYYSIYILSLFFFKLIYFIYLSWLRWVFIAVRGLLFVAVCGLLVEVVSLVVEHGL